MNSIKNILMKQYVIQQKYDSVYGDAQQNPIYLI